LSTHEPIPGILRHVHPLTRSFVHDGQRISYIPVYARPLATFNLPNVHEITPLDVVGRDLRDPYTGGHSRRVTAYCAQLLAALGMHGPEVELVLAAARVHDIGKIGIPDAILNKPGKLTDAERAEMERHPVLGADLLARQGGVGRGVQIVRHHHEAWDGSGYPAGLAGLDIPFGARVIAVADSYDAMTSDRPYRAGMPQAKAESILRAGRGQQWDPTLVDAFLHALGEQEGLRPAPATGGTTDPTETDALRIPACQPQQHARM
jgi:HD-GYP domain-containing protein (c-di-GMP phosphodiesterase class II)